MANKIYLESLEHVKYDSTNRNNFWIIDWNIMKVERRKKEETPRTAIYMVSCVFFLFLDIHSCYVIKGFVQEGRNIYPE